MTRKLLNKEEIIGRTRVFFNSKRWKDTLLFLGFVLLASSYWVLQNFRQKFDFEVPLVVHYVNVPVGIALSSKLPQEITLYIQDSGTAFFNYSQKKKKKSFFINIDLEAASTSSASYLVNQTSLLNLINEKLLPTSQLKSFYPDKIDINYSLLIQKELPVAVNGNISPASGFIFLDSILVEPSKVVAYGNKDDLDSIQVIHTLPVDSENIDKDWSVFADLQIPEGIKVSDDKVKLSATIEEFTEKSFELSVVCKNLPPNLRVHFFPSVVELKVSVGLSEYSQLSKSDFEISVDYNELKDRNSANCSPILSRKPSSLKIYRILPNIIEFLFEQKND